VFFGAGLGGLSMGIKRWRTEPREQERTDTSHTVKHTHR